MLNEDHYGLEKIKDRILEFLAVRQLVGQTKSSIICFVGPPGVGKSSLAKSIARATGRKFVRLSLGGVRDEAEIRGHRRTYIGAFPGQIIQMMRRRGRSTRSSCSTRSTRCRWTSGAIRRRRCSRCWTRSRTTRSSTTTSTSTTTSRRSCSSPRPTSTHTIPPPLKDRMEIIPLSGYTLNEKLAIAQQFLVPRQLKDARPVAGRRSRSTTRRSGCSSRATPARPACAAWSARSPPSAARSPAGWCGRARGSSSTVEARDGVRAPGQARSSATRRKNEESEIGVATGLAWTEVGGELLETEVGLMPGKGKLTLTGKLGEVMQESARAAVSYLRSRAELLGIEPDFNESLDIHIHVPEGAIPKDGPSAGITMATALISALTKIPVRKDVAMTGEITLRGKVLPVGGIKDKVLAAYRAGINEIILPAREREGPRGDPGGGARGDGVPPGRVDGRGPARSPWTAPSSRCPRRTEVHEGVSGASGGVGFPGPLTRPVRCDGVARRVGLRGSAARARASD